MNEKKYKLTNETITCLGKVLRRIEALKCEYEAYLWDLD